MARADCGGCRNEGRHRKHCPASPDFDLRLMYADRAESVGDSIGSNNFEAANLCYAAAGVLRREARALGKAADHGRT